MKKKQAKKTLQRIAEINTQVKYHKENIRRLQTFADGDLKIKGAKHQRTPDDEKRCHWTLQNITAQVVLLQHELAVLRQYGA
jgi:hypothetical protein